MSYTVAQNASFLTFASVLQKIVSFSYFTIVARFVGVGNTGNYFFAISFTTVFAVLSDLGLRPVLTREAAKYPENSENYFNTVLWSKLFLGIIAYLLVVLAANLLNYSPELKLLIYISGITMFFDSIQSIVYGIFRARKNLIYESFSIVMSQIITLVIGTVALLMKAPMVWLIAAYAIPSGSLILFTGYFLRNKYGVRLRLKLDKKVLKTFMVFALPFALGGILGRLYSFSDSIMMSKMLTEQHLGWWSVPYKITAAFQFIPMALAASVYPAMSSFTVSEPEKIGELFLKAWRYLFVAVFPLSLGIMAVAEPVITSLYGIDYLPSVSALRILLISLIFSYLSIISESLLSAVNKQKIQTISIGVALVINIGMNLVLIPRYNIIGAAYSALVSNIVLWAIGYYYVNKLVRIDNGILRKAVSQSIIPAFLMALVVYLLTLKVSYFFTIPIGAVLYGTLLFFTGIIDKLTIRRFISKFITKTV